MNNFTIRFLVKVSFLFALICFPLITFSAITLDELLEKAASDPTAKNELYRRLWQGICDAKSKDEIAKFYRENQLSLLPKVSVDSSTIFGSIKYRQDSDDWQPLGKDGNIVYNLPEVGRNGGKWEGESFDLSISLLLDDGIETNIISRIHPFVFEVPISIKAPVHKQPSTFKANVNINGTGRFFLMVGNPQDKNKVEAQIVGEKKQFQIDLPFSWRDDNLSCELHSICPIDEKNCHECKQSIKGIWNSKEKLISIDSIPVTLGKKIKVNVPHNGIYHVTILVDNKVSPPDLKNNNQGSEFSIDRHSGNNGKRNITISIPLINWSKEYSINTYSEYNEDSIKIPEDVIRRYKEKTDKVSNSLVKENISVTSNPTDKTVTYKNDQTKKVIKFFWSNRVPLGTTKVYIHYRSKNNKKGLLGGLLSKADGKRVFELADGSSDYEYGFTKSGIDTPDTWKNISPGEEVKIYLPIEPIPYSDEKNFVRNIKRKMSEYMARIKIPRRSHVLATDFSKYLNQNEAILSSYFEHVRSVINVSDRDPLCKMLIEEMATREMTDPYEWTIADFKDALISIFKNTDLDKSKLGTEHTAVKQ